MKAEGSPHFNGAFAATHAQFEQRDIVISRPRVAWASHARGIRANDMIL